MKILTFVILVIILLGISSTLSAIRLAMRIFNIDHSAQLTDTIPPTKPTLEISQILRGYGKLDKTILYSEDSDYGSITFNVSGSQDNVTQSNNLGYKFHHIKGTFPEGLFLPPDIYHSHNIRKEHLLWISWLDGATWNQDAFEFSVAVTSFDRAGNESGLSNIVTVKHNGDLSEQRAIFLKHLEDTRQQIKKLKQERDTLRSQPN